MPDYKRLIRGKSSGRKISPFIQRSKQASFKIIIISIIALLAVGAFFAARSFLSNFAGFEIKKVTVADAQGKARPDPESILRLDKSENLFSFDAGSAARDIQARRPEFLSVLIRKQFPHTLLIIAERRKPLAILGIRKTRLTDAEGFILPYESTYKDLPRIVGVHPMRLKLYEKSASLRLNKALDLLQALKEAKIYPEYRVSQIDVRKYSDVIFYLKDKVKVKMGQDGFARKGRLLKGILARLKKEDTLPEYIDMRFGNPSVLPRN